jgi:hypothetical protein
LYTMQLVDDKGCYQTCLVDVTDVTNNLARIGGSSSNTYLFFHECVSH